ncbi:MAG: GNAT family N-acetyltransferase [Verrucomicrobiota bacterium]
MNLDELIIRPLTRDEFEIAVDWAADEGWNPGLHDADVFWQTDPEGFYGAELDGRLAATGSVVSYSGRYGFMGFFIVREDLRGRGIGTRLWFHRRDLLKSRLEDGASIGMDGVFDMQEWYAQGEFEFTHRNLRMEGIGQAATQDSRVHSLSDVSLDSLTAFDAIHFGFPREAFLKAWITLPDSTALAFTEDNQLKGYGVIRRCREGHKIGPLFASEPEVAESLFQQLASRAKDEAIWLDIPEINSVARDLADRYELTEVCGCARMYYGGIPQLPWDQIFGITTFELG